jgi:hypothetical protein
MLKVFITAAVVLLAACSRGSDEDPMCQWTSDWYAAADKRLAEGPPLTSEQREAMNHAQGEVERIRQRRHCE